ncbi:hypothetical protein ACIBJC_00955 [Streptomyces sp. NPDC050509]|uniref:hypothetical protein n=1 Tax=Streptomyces sp. NPDC050509 TaxID=3365620 RepID=UPI00379EA4DF
MSRTPWSAPIAAWLATTKTSIDWDGTGVLTPVPLALRAMIFFVKGDIAAAEKEAAAGLAASKRAEMPLYDPPLRAVLVFCALQRGDLAAAAHALWRLLTGLVASAESGPHAAIDEIRELAQDSSLRRKLVLEAPVGVGPVLV